MKNKKQIIWMIVLLGAIILFLITGCKPKQIITERVITRVDSTAVLKLQEQLEERSKEVEDFKAELRQVREENSRLQSEVSTMTTKYDTSKPIIPETGKPPVMEETKTESKSVLERKVKELKDVNVEQKQVIESLTLTNSNLQYEIKQLLNENSELKSKTIPRTGFNFKLCVWSFIIGLFVGAFVWLKFGNIIKKIWKK